VLATVLVFHVAEIAEVSGARHEEPDENSLNIIGKWKVESFLRKGNADREFSSAQVDADDGILVFKTELHRTEIRFFARQGDGVIEVDWRTQLNEADKEFVIRFNGIAKRNGDTITYAFPEKSTGARPTEFSSTEANRQSLIVLRKIADGPP
jgi:hypothetical protein